MSVQVHELAQYLDELLQTASIPDYPQALNGLQCEHRGPVRKIAAAVDFSRRAVEDAVACDANFLLVHHGMFWGGTRPLVGPLFERIASLVRHDIAVYSSHLPLDAHASLGNAALLARELGLEPAFPFAYYSGVAVGTAGEADLSTSDLHAQLDRFARDYGGSARASFLTPGRRTRRWAICTGAGASSDTLREARDLAIDTLITGEGPHHTAVDAPESGLVIIYAGHYATETLGVRAVGEHLARHFNVPWEFILAPTAL